MTELSFQCGSEETSPFAAGWFARRYMSYVHVRTANVFWGTVLLPEATVSRFLRIIGTV